MTSVLLIVILCVRTYSGDIVYLLSAFTMMYVMVSAYNMYGHNLETNAKKLEERNSRVVVQSNLIY